CELSTPADKQGWTKDGIQLTASFDRFFAAYLVPEIAGGHIGCAQSALVDEAHDPCFLRCLHDVFGASTHDGIKGLALALDLADDPYKVDHTVHALHGAPHFVRVGNAACSCAVAERA